MADVYKPNENANNSDDFCEHVAEVIEFALEWRLLADLRRDGVVDVANGCFLACIDDDSVCVAVDHGCSLHE